MAGDNDGGIVRNTEVTKFIKSSRDGNKAFIAQRCFNRFGWYLEVIQYVVGGPRGLIVIPEGREGRGWRSFAAELRKVVAFFEFSLSTGSRVLFPCQPAGGSKSTDVGGSFSVSMGKELMLGGGKTYAEVLGRVGQL